MQYIVDLARWSMRCRSTPERGDVLTTSRDRSILRLMVHFKSSDILFCFLKIKIATDIQGTVAAAGALKAQAQSSLEFVCKGGFLVFVFITRLIGGLRYPL